eukprot:1185030-Prorocentrum_minimum.AAC.4
MIAGRKVALPKLSKEFRTTPNREGVGFGPIMVDSSGQPAGQLRIGSCQLGAQSTVFVAVRCLVRWCHHDGGYITSFVGRTVVCQIDGPGESPVIPLGASFLDSFEYGNIAEA